MSTTNAVPPRLADGGRASRHVSFGNQTQSGAGTKLAEHLLDCEAEAIMRKMVDKAKQGNTTAMRLCLERMLPPKRNRSVRFRMPTPVSAADACESLAAITRAVARGELTPAEAVEMAVVVEKFVSILQTTEIERRLRVLETASTPEQKGAFNE